MSLALIEVSRAYSINKMDRNDFSQYVDRAKRVVGFTDGANGAHPLPSFGALCRKHHRSQDDWLWYETAVRLRTVCSLQVLDLGLDHTNGVHGGYHDRW